MTGVVLTVPDSPSTGLTVSVWRGLGHERRDDRVAQVGVALVGQRLQRRRPAAGITGLSTTPLAASIAYLSAYSAYRLAGWDWEALVIPLVMSHISNGTPSSLTTMTLPVRPFCFSSGRIPVSGLLHCE